MQLVLVLVFFLYYAVTVCGINSMTNVGSDKLPTDRYYVYTRIYINVSRFRAVNATEQRPKVSTMRGTRVSYGALYMHIHDKMRVIAYCASDSKCVCVCDRSLGGPYNWTEVDDLVVVY